MLTPVFKLLGVLGSDTEPGRISLAFSLAMIAGLAPLSSPHNLLVLLIVLILKVNISAFLLGYAFFGTAAYLMDPLLSWIGLKVLTAGALAPLWTSLYNMTFFRLLRFNNSILMGSLVFSLAMFVPLLLLSNLAIRKYREHVLEWVRKTRVMQAYKASNFYRLYTEYRKLRDIL